MSLSFDTTEEELLGSSKAQHQLDPDSKRYMTCGSGEITFSELTPLKGLRAGYEKEERRYEDSKEELLQLSCYGRSGTHQSALHQSSARVCTRRARRLRKLERKRQRAPENPRTHNGPPNRSLTPQQVILEIKETR